VRQEDPREESAVSDYAKGGLISTGVFPDGIPVTIEVGERIQFPSGQVLELQRVEGGVSWVRVSTDEQEQVWRDKMRKTLTPLNEGGGA
jgi:hypothetical protein